MILRYSFFIPVVIICVSGSCFAQSDRGFDIWADPEECESFIVSPPALFPVFRGDMPLDVRLAYAAIDTICKTLTYDEIKATIAQLSDDSLATAYRVFQRASNYDPFLLMYQWKYSTYSSVPDSYRSVWSNVTNLLTYEYNKRFNGTDAYKGERLDMNDLSVLCTRSDGIYLVRVLSATERSYIDSSRYEPCNTTVHCADCEVLQVLQGQRYYSNCNPKIHELDTGTGCIRYHWQTSCDSAYSSDPHYFHMQPNSEYLVFTNYMYEDNEEFPDRRYSVHALRKFEVVNGMLLDPNHYFGEGVTVSYDTVESRIETTMNELLGENIEFGSCFESAGSIDLQAYPQPSKDQLTLRVKSNTGHVHGILYSELGKKMEEFDVDLVNTMVTEEVVNIQRYSSGVYYLLLDNGEGVKIERVQIRK